MNSKILIILVVLPFMVNSRPTHCERHNGDLEFRCAKDNYKADYVHVKNIAGFDVSFKVGKWFSKCGESGVNYADDGYSLGPDGYIDIDFSGAKEGACNELFVYDCKYDNKSVNCIDAVTVYPI